MTKSDVQPLVGFCLLVVLGMVGRLKLVGKSDRETWESVWCDASLYVLGLASAFPIAVLMPTVG
jgi:hypothetical protein